MSDCLTRRMTDHIASHCECDLFDVGLSLFCDNLSGCTPVVSFGVDVDCGCLEQASLLSVALLASSAAEYAVVLSVNTGP